MTRKIKRTKHSGGMRYKFVAVWVMGLLVLISAGHASAQQITGSIVGTVKDEQGASVSGALVKATNVSSRFP